MAKRYRVDPEQLERQYREHLSDYRTWEQRAHAADWMVFPENLDPRLSIDETAIQRDELYTVVTNKAARGRQGALVAMVKGTKVEDVAAALLRIPLNQRAIVTEVTLDMADTMEAIVRRVFPNATLVTDRFHVQQLVSGALQELRIAFRKTAIQAENAARKAARVAGTVFTLTVHANGDTSKQLLARSRYLLFKPTGQWTESQRERATILFRAHPILKTAYDLSMMFRGCYEQAATVAEGRERLHAWYVKAREKAKEHEEIEVFTTPMETVQTHEETILNYFTPPEHERIRRVLQREAQGVPGTGARRQRPPVLPLPRLTALRVSASTRLPTPWGYSPKIAGDPDTVHHRRTFLARCQRKPEQNAPVFGLSISRSTMLHHYRPLSLDCLRDFRSTDLLPWEA